MFNGLPSITNSPEFMKLVQGLTGGLQKAVPQEPQYDGEPLTVTPGEENPYKPDFSLGNILGSIGDAFLVQGGAAPSYAPWRQQQREGWALRNFGEMPMEAAGEFIKTNPGEGIKLFNQVQDNARQNNVANSQIGMNSEKIQDLVDTRAMSLLRAANDKTYPKLRDKARSYYVSRGLTPPDLPEVYDPDYISGLTMGNVPVDKQIDQQDLRTYRGETIEQRREAAKEATRRAQIVQDNQNRRTQLIQDRTDSRTDKLETGRTNRTTLIQDRTDSRAKAAEEGRDRRFQPRSGIRPRARFKRNPDGSTTYAK